jgi:hypothetical protein
MHHASPSPVQDISEAMIERGEMLLETPAKQQARAN